MLRTIAAGLLACTVSLTAAPLWAQTDRVSATSVDRVSFSASALGGMQGGQDNAMALGTVTMPVGPGVSLQFDVGLGTYRDEYRSAVAAAHLFWRYDATGAFGLYFDYGYVNPEHSGRLGLEGSWYFGRASLDALVGVRTGTNVFTSGFDEIDLSYYVTDDLKASVGHRGTSRGHVGNLGFEFAPPSLAGWSIFGEAELGEDDTRSAFAGLRYAFGQNRYGSLLERDRSGPMRVRVPRNVVDVTRCGALPQAQDATFGLREMTVLCASKAELDDENAAPGKAQ